MKDPNTGKFAKGNPGRPKGAKNVRTLQWEELGELITGQHAEHFVAVLEQLMQSPTLAYRIKGADLFLRTLDYFKPKLSRIQQVPEPDKLIPPLIVRDGVAEVPDDWPGFAIRVTREVMGGPVEPINEGAK